jgi:hypothetical protein
MEDTHSHVLELEEGSDKTNSFFAVYDGHGGQSSINLYKNLSHWLFLCFVFSFLQVPLHQSLPGLPFTSG